MRVVVPTKCRSPGYHQRHCSSMTVAAVTWFMLLASLFILIVPSAAFVSPLCSTHRSQRFPIPSLSLSSLSSSSTRSSSEDPQVFSTGYSTKTELLEAIQEATDQAVAFLPKLKDGDGSDSSSSKKGIDLAIITVSSIYDGQSSPSVIVPAVLSSASVYGQGIQHLIGCTAGGIISSRTNLNLATKGGAATGACIPVETEGLPGVSITLGILPDVEIKTFHVLGEDVPDDVGRVPQDEFKNAIGLGRFGAAFHQPERIETDNDSQQQQQQQQHPVFMLLPNPAFQNELDDLLQGISYAFPSSTAFGGIASTVSSLTRARLFRHDAHDPQCIQTLADGCVGVAMQGDIEIKTMIAQGAKPVGGVYRVVAGKDQTIQAVALDDDATQELLRSKDDTKQNSDSDEQTMDAKTINAMQRAMLPKPPLAEANFLMKTLSDDDQTYMRKALLIGVERGGSMGRTPSNLKRLAEGKGHSYFVNQVANAGMKDGSITMPLGSVNVQPGTRLRYYVREREFAMTEVEALWMGYNKNVLAESMQKDDNEDSNSDGVGTNNRMFAPTLGLVFSTSDRGSKLFGGKAGYESRTAMKFMPALPSINGFYTNGILGKLDESGGGVIETMVHASASQYVLFGSKSRRPVYFPQNALLEEEAAARKTAKETAGDEAIDAEDEERTRTPATVTDLEKRAPRSEDGELILKRREIHSGRALTVSTVEWSVADKAATPTSVLEGYMWDKETEVDRFRERVPLSNLLSQCKLSMVDPSSPKPRDWVGPLKQLAAEMEDRFVFVPECKRMEPIGGSLRKRYDVAKLTKQLTLSGAPAISVNCDTVLFGGSLDDISKARDASSSAAASLSSSAEDTSDDGVVVPPILASDLILYPYQVYKIRLAGADAVTLVPASLAGKDLLYLAKIARSLQLQVLVSVTSEVQIRSVTDLVPGIVSALIVSNRELEDFSFDMTGEQALGLLNSDAMREFRAKHGEEVPILVEGRLGIIERADDNGVPSAAQYFRELKEAGALGGIVGSSLASRNEEDGGISLEELIGAT